MTEVWESSKKL